MHESHHACTCRALLTDRHDDNKGDVNHQFPERRLDNGILCSVFGENVFRRKDSCVVRSVDVAQACMCGVMRERGVSVRLSRRDARCQDVASKQDCNSSPDSAPRKPPMPLASFVKMVSSEYVE